jgi:APA family basic amino acid/polyamine antiporter
MAVNRRDAAALARNNARRAGGALLVTGMLGSGMVLMSYSSRWSMASPSSASRDRGKPAAVPVRSLALASLWRRGDKAGVRGMLAGRVLGTAYVSSPSSAWGMSPSSWACAARRGLPLYVFMRGAARRRRVGA